MLPNSISYEQLAGPLNDYSEVVDPTTDLPAVASNTQRAAVAAMSRMSERIFVVWTNNGTDATIVDFDSVVGNAVEYRPTITKQGTGHWRMTFPAFVTDMLGDQRAWNFRHGDGCALHNEPIHVQVKKVAPNIVDVYMWILPAATANDVGGVQIMTRVY